MTIQQFPMFRLVALLARQLSAPIATRIKDYARVHPRLSRTCMGTGRAYHVCELRYKLWSLALIQPRNLAPLSNKAALESGANILGEVVVFGLGGGIIIFEVNRQANKQEDKILDEESQWLGVLVSLEELQRELVLQQQDIDRLQAALRPYAPRGFPQSLGPATPSPAPPESKHPVASEEQRPTPADLLPPCPPPPELDEQCPPDPLSDDQ